VKHSVQRAAATGEGVDLSALPAGNTLVAALRRRLNRVLPQGVANVLLFGASAAAVGGAATAILTSQIRKRHETELAESNNRARLVLEELQTEEMRVRRAVSEQLHGGLQNRMVVIAAGIDGVARALQRNGDAAHAAELRALSDELDYLREREVRNLSHTLFPAGIELGAVRAIRAMLHRLPPQINAQVNIGPQLEREIAKGVPLAPLAERLLIVSLVEEATTNAIKHGGATEITIQLDIDGEPGAHDIMLHGLVEDNGHGLPPDYPGVLTNTVRAGADANDTGSASVGLARHNERLQRAGGSLRLWSPPEGGTRLEFSIPLPRDWALSEATEPPYPETVKA